MTTSRPSTHATRRQPATKRLTFGAYSPAPKVMSPSRRDFLKAGGLGVAGFAIASGDWVLIDWLIRGGRVPATAPEVIEMRSDPSGSCVWFDPIGLLVAPGTTVRWVARENVHTTTAYHPRNDNHSLRIPDGAVPWDSGFLVDPGAHFDVTLTIPGVYDYYCMPHEAAGMVGRIVVGGALGPGAQSFDYWSGKPGTERWKRVPEAARKNLPSAARIIAERRVHPSECGRDPA